jgi:hypothetical protein
LTVEFGKDFVGGLGPGEGLAVLVPALAEPTDGGSEIGDAGRSPRRRAWRSTMEKNTSTRFSQDAEVGVKCSWIRRCLASQPRTTGCLWVA